MRRSRYSRQILFPAPGELPTCDTAGILGPAASAVAALEVAQALRVLLGKADDTVTRLKYVDVWSGELLTLGLARDPDCASCVRGEFPYLEGEAGSGTTVMCGRVFPDGRALVKGTTRPGVARALYARYLGI